MLRQLVDGEAKPPAGREPWARPGWLATLSSHGQHRPPASGWPLPRSKLTPWQPSSPLVCKRPEGAQWNWILVFSYLFSNYMYFTYSGP